jgi:cytochrome P450
MAAAESVSISPLINPDSYVADGYPHDIWTRLRREDPVHWVEENPEMPFWAITKHADISAIGKQPDKFLNGPTLLIRTEPDRRGESNFPPTLIDMDPPKHGAYRKIIAKRFTPGALKRLHGDIEGIAKEIVDSLLEQGESGEVDFVEKVAAPLPIAVIAWLLGVPRSDWNLLFEWTNRTIGSGDPEYQVEGQTPSETANQAMVELFQYFTKLVEEKKKNPADDLVTVFANAEVNGEKLPPMDVLTYCLIIVIAGNETTRNATSGGMLALAQNPGELARIQKDLSLLPSAVEEIVRWTSPIIHFARTTTQDVEIRDKKIKKGQHLALFYPSANRDEEIFEDPFTFRVDRRPNRHLGFGIGEHFCAGAHVARLELENAFRYLIPRLEEVEVIGEPKRLRSHLVGGIKHLPIRYRLKPA